MNSSDILKKIELNYSVENLKYNNVHIWAFIKPYLLDAILVKSDTQKTERVKVDAKLLLLFLKSFFYGFINVFKKYDFLVFSAAERRKEYKGVFYDRVADGVSEIYPKETLFIENPLYQGHYKNIPTENIVSQVPFFILNFILGEIKFDKRKLECANILDQITEDYKISFNYKKIVKRYVGQYNATSLLLRFYKPKKVFFVSLSNLLGCVRAFKDNEVKVIELQHGVINKEHSAYNSYVDLNEDLSPDLLLTYGEMELNNFHKENYFINKNKVKPIGYYFFSKYEYFKLDKSLALLRDKYSKIVVFSSQDIFDQDIIPFLKRVAEKEPEITYLFKPRHAGSNFLEYELPKNFIIEKKHSIYDLMAIADVHSTVSSTCAIESTFFGVPNIMIDILNNSYSYYGEKIFNNIVFVKTEKEFIDSFNFFNSKKKNNNLDEFEKFFTPNFLKNIKKVLDA